MTRPPTVACQDDRPGASMRAAVAAFDPRDVDDLVAWLETLREQ